MFWNSCTYCMPWIFPILFPIVFPFLFMFLFGRHFFGNMFGCFRPVSHNDDAKAENDSSPLDRLKMRYANGEIKAEQFEEMKARIEA